ncbi:SPOR domain-containing protein [Vibrio diazotrophicus]|uniref:SPOR domain-containing protein n=1 Tax=Vibrio diazotrophicus TaxID=685 RepID=UPI00142D3552|nr:SPOR domain-containing protein [Vibrio diazotrophicus]NIY93207.1 SPOR domain-containing protein [Vibrio diazotrophicus]
MDIKGIAMPKLSHLLLIGLPFCFASQTLLAAEPEQFLCGGTQTSTNELPRLNSNCPIGKGLWGKSAPKGKDSSFWIQCGLLNESMPLSRAKVLYQHISTDVWMKPEGKALRCLIGPYNDYATAKKELAGVRSEKLYKEAFIREVRKGEQDAPVVTAKKPASKPKNTPKKVVASKSKPVAKPAAKAKPVVMPATTKAAPKATKEMSTITIRREATLGGIHYVVPYVMDEKEQFYMEHDLAWNRLSYADAEKRCQQQKMRLATEVEWKQLLDSKVMEKDKWPVYLPYWGENSKGFFTTGKVNTLKGTSLLNVLCVK